MTWKDYDMLIEDASSIVSTLERIRFYLDRPEDPESLFKMKTLLETSKQKIDIHARRIDDVWKRDLAEKKES